MKLLIDENLSRKLPERLSDVFPHSAHVTKVGYRSSSDHSIAKYAIANDFVIVTKDHDLQEIALTTQPELKVVLFQVGNIGADYTEALIRRHKEEILALDGNSGLRILIVQERSK